SPGRLRQRHRRAFFYTIMLNTMLAITSTIPPPRREEICAYEIYHSVTGRSREEYYSTAIAILTIANIFAIIFAALLDMIGNK
ncbi:2-hydroxycarboxylate transporter family protein, partial [Salmonella enterica]|uniref:2-hydroxycarboxylate transporter family protein n=1 Tax=Salmonella enterica TaxID=28901 RepID=UPI00218055BB